MLKCAARDTAALFPNFSFSAFQLFAAACYSARVLNSGTTRFQLGAAAVALGALWFVLCRQLSGEWSLNEQYSYGWFVPFFAAYLFWLRWEDRPDRRGPPEAP